MKLISRLQLYINFKGISYNSFNKSIGATTGYISRMIKNEASVGSDMIEKIIEIYPDLNIYWLFTGNGSMIIDERLDPKNSIIIDQANQIMELREEIEKFKTLNNKQNQ